jgi:hypothetical protein
MRPTYIGEFMTVHFYPKLLSFPSTPSPIADHDILRNGEEDYREDRGLAAGCQLLLAGVLPS